MGGAVGRHRRLEVEGIVSPHACDQRESDHPGQTGSAQHVRVPCLQNENSRTNLRVDVQSEDQRQAREMDIGGCRFAPSNLKTIPNYIEYKSIINLAEEFYFHNHNYY